MTRPVNLPGMPAVPTDLDKGLRDFLGAVRTHLTVRNSPQANHPDRAVTLRDLKAAMAKTQTAAAGTVTPSAPSAIPLTTERLLALLDAAITADQLDPDLAERLNVDTEDLPALSQQVVDLQDGLDGVLGQLALITAYAWTLLSAATAADARATLGVESSGQRFYPDQRPTTPSAWDDEFDATTLDAKWTRNANDGDHQTSGSGYYATTSYDVDTTWPSCYQARIVQGATQKGWSLQQAFVPGAGAFSVTAKFLGHYRGNYGGSSIYLMDSSMANGVRANVGVNTGVIAIPNLAGGLSTKATTWTYDRVTAPLVHTGMQFVHIARDGSNAWTLYISGDGWSWVKVGSYTLTVTVAKLVVCGFLDGEVADRHLGIDWIRVNALTLP